MTSIDPVLDDVLAIAEQARDYLRCGRGPRGSTGLAPLYEAVELSRISARLGYCTAWLLARRAVHTGELSQEEAIQPRWRLEGQEICGREPVDADQLPPELATLCARSLAVYQRIERLDRQLDS
jgi:regulator of CtrA degradation